MQTYTVLYSGNNRQFKTFCAEINANSQREAVEEAYKEYCEDNYFPQEDGTILNRDGEVIASPEDDVIDFDGGIFYATE